MIYTISMRAETRRAFRDSRQNVDYNDVLKHNPEVTLVSTFDHGRCAKVKLEESGLNDLRASIGDKFVISENVKFERF